ncbi:golgi-associated PDZ and coiled-coil motif-containing protein-like, partial [Asbolus verrucosus]
AELIHMRAELVESKAKREVLEQELHNLLLQLHSSQLSQLPDSLSNRKQDPNFKPDVNNIKKKLEAELRQSPIRNIRINKESDELKFSSTLMESAQYRAENEQLQLENEALRKSILSLNSEVYGAKLAAKYLDKELAGRIQQLQLLGREMRGDVRDKLWRQLESEILLQRHKTVVRACRRNSILNNSEKSCPKPEIDPINERTEHFGDIRTVVVKRSPSQGLGISITGGREHGVPILISELEPNGPAALSEQLYIGDAILSVNDRDLRQACHREAVDILQQQTGDCTLQVQYIAADDSDTSLEEDGYNFRFFDGEVCDPNNHSSLNPSNSLDVLNTPTAPRTPESSSAASRIVSRTSVPNSPEIPRVQKLIVLEETEDVDSNIFNYNLNNTNGNVEVYKATSTKDIKIADDLNCNSNNNANPTTEINRNLNQMDFKVDTTDLVLFDNATNNVIKLEDFKKVDIIDDDNFNCSTNSLNSENFSSPMQTSADVFLDSELLSTDIASNDSQSPKNIQPDTATKPNFTYQEPTNFCMKPQIYTSNESLSNPKSDQSLLNSGESYGSSPVHKASNRDYKKVQRKHKKKYFGVKTLQSIFNKHDGYSDISSTASELGEDLSVETRDKVYKAIDNNKNENKEKEAAYKSNTIYADTSPQFEENIHNILSDIFVKNFATSEHNVAAISLNKPIGTKKYFSLHGQNLRVGKALRLCPNEDFTEQVENEQRKEKLLARYVYNANSINADGVGDPDFGTPV